MGQTKRLRNGSGERYSESRKTRGLQIDEDLPFQKRDWLAQRVGWAALALLVAAGLLGLTGSGPLSHTSSTDGRGLVVEYERFVRHSARSNLTIQVEPGALPSDKARVTISRGYLAAQELQQIVPEPVSTRSRADEIEFRFNIQPREGLHVRWTFEPDALGEHAATVRLNDGPPVAIVQFTYP